MVGFKGIWRSRKYDEEVNKCIKYTFLIKEIINRIFYLWFCKFPRWLCQPKRGVEPMNIDHPVGVGDRWRKSSSLPQYVNSSVRI